MNNDLNDDNFLIYAAKCYETATSIQSEFQDDLRRIKYIKRLAGKYRASGELKERLVLNHIIVLSNVFGVEAAIRLLFLKVDPIDYSFIKTFLTFLNIMPDMVKHIKGNHIISTAIPLNTKVAQRLRDSVNGRET